MDQPCKACPRRGGQSAWQLIGCQRGRLETQIKICLPGSSHGPLPWHDLQASINNCLATATRRCHLQTQDLQQDPNYSSILKKLRQGQSTISGWDIFRTASFTANQSERRTCSGCSECLHFLRFPSYTHHQFDYRKCFIRLLWELGDNRSAIKHLKLGPVSRIRELIRAASRYAAESGDVVSDHN